MENILLCVLAMHLHKLHKKLLSSPCKLKFAHPRLLWHVEKNNKNNSGPNSLIRQTAQCNIHIQRDFFFLV